MQLLAVEVPLLYLIIDSLWNIIRIAFLFTFGALLAVIGIKIE